MEIQQIRNATMKITYAGLTFLTSATGPEAFL